MGRPVIITLTVSASSLYAIVDATTAQIDANCSIFDDTPGRPPYTGTNEAFTSQVNIGNTVKWQGQTKFPNGADRGYAVSIVSVEYEADPNDPNDVSFFPSPLAGTPLNGRTSDASTTITNNSALVGKHDVYKINFRVYATGQNNKPYSIDPKLQANP